MLRDLTKHPRRTIRLPALMAEAFVLTVIALMVVSGIGIAQAGFFGLFLAGAPLSGRFQTLLQENKDLIFVKKQPSRQANATTALSILAMFLGICGAYLPSAIVLSEADLATYFGFIFESTQSLEGTLLTRDFSNFFPILKHNLLVLSTTAVLCLIYRSYGALLTLGWNACVWVIVLVSLTRRLLGPDLVDSAVVSGWAFVAVVPHLVLEGAAYVLIALAAILYSKGVTKYLVPLTLNAPGSEASLVAQAMPKDTVFFDITVVCAKLTLTAVGVLVIAALLEVFYATWMLSLLRAWMGG